MLLKRIYGLLVSGLLGGLIASLVHQDFFVDELADIHEFEARLLPMVGLGAAIGFVIGFAIILYENLASLAFSRALRVAVLGAILCAVGGAVTLPLAEYIHGKLNGGSVGRATAWATFGFVIGLTISFSCGARRWRPMLGGALGGMLAGIGVEHTLSIQETYDQSAIVALLLVGAFVALGVALAVNIYSEAYLEGLPGSKVEGHVFHLGKFREPELAYLGSDKKKGDIFIWIPDAQGQHASICLTSRGANIANLTEKGQTFVNGNPIIQYFLQDGDTIEIGSCRFRFRSRHFLKKSKETKS